MSQLSDVSADDLKKLAGYLKGFPSDDEDEEADQYWYQLACTLRKRRGNTYNYSEQFLVRVGEYEDDAALVFLKDLSKRGIQLEEFIHSLEVIKCQQALQFFQPGAPTTPAIRGRSEEDLRRDLKVGETLELNVQATCHPGPLHYAWFHNQRPLPGNNSPHLVIHNVTTGHAGTYHCKVTNPAITDSQLSSAHSQSMKVEVTQEDPIIRQETSAGPVLPPPVITAQPSNVTLYRRPQLPNSVTFQCKAQQTVTYDWYKNGELYRRNCPDGELVLSGIGAGDAGNYHCVVVNDGGQETSSTATLTILSDISISHQTPKTQKVRVGGKLELTCAATSLTANLQYEWFRVDRTLHGEKEVQSLGKVQTLSPIVTDEKLTSKGKLYFRCRVTDITDPTDFVYSETVEVKVETVWIAEQPSDVHAAIKQRTQLTCSGGGGILKYVWLKSSTTNGRFDVVKTTQDGLLPFDPLSNLDAGYYQCQVEGRLQHADSRVVEVQALLPHAMQAAKTVPIIKITREPRAFVVAEGAPFRLLFEAVCSTADPLNYQWYFSGSKVNGATSNDYVCESASVEDCGPYWCSVRAGEGPACVLSQSVRVELQYEEMQPPGSSWQQREGERFFRTRGEERFAREKIALLIGNSHYHHSDLSDLTTPQYDISALQKVLEKPPHNFKVFSLLDLTHAEMQKALEMFYSLLGPVSGTYALFYFSGHGFSTHNHNNFLVPVDSPPDPSHCFQVDTITRRMQDTFSRAILILDACKVVKGKVHPDDSTAYSSIGNTSNMFELWSCVDSMAASDAVDQWGPYPTSQFNRALIKAINTDRLSLGLIHQHLLEELIKSGCRQRPVSRTGMSDLKITLQDSIMMDNQSLEPELDKVLRDYVSAHFVPEPVLLHGAEMKDLNQFANLKLSFSLLLTNLLCVDAELHQVHGDKTSSASVTFDSEFLESQGVECSQDDPLINGREEGLCARASLAVRGLQKLKCPLKLLIKVCLWESGQERTACITYAFQDLPFIATNWA